jgi:CheY-like chemotaxis protein
MTEEKVLIVDDSTELISLLENILPYGGYRTISARSGEEGLDLAQQLNPDVILVDLELPDITGLKFLEELGKRELKIPTIMMTGYGSEGIAARALRLGASSYLIKPFTTEEVLSSVEKALALGRLRREKSQMSALLDLYTRHFRTISAIGRAMITGLDLDEFYQRIVDAGSFVTRAERCFLSVLDTDLGQMQVLAVRGKAGHSGRHFSSQAGDDRLRAVMAQGLCTNLHASSDLTIVLQTGDPVKAVLQVPLKTKDRVIGFLSVDRQGTGVPFGKHDEQMLGILSDYVVIALQRYHKDEATDNVASGS